MNRRDLLMAGVATIVGGSAGPSLGAIRQRLQPWTVHAGDDPHKDYGADVFCENGHYAFTVGPVNEQTGWPTVLNAAGEDVTGKYIGRLMPLRCDGCGAVAMQMVGW